MNKFNQQRPPNNAPAKSAQPSLIATAASPAANERKQDLRAPARDGDKLDKPAAVAAVPSSTPSAVIAPKPDATAGNAPNVDNTAVS